MHLHRTSTRLGGKVANPGHKSMIPAHYQFDSWLVAQCSSQEQRRKRIRLTIVTSRLLLRSAGEMGFLGIEERRGQSVCFTAQLRSRWVSNLTTEYSSTLTTVGKIQRARRLLQVTSQSKQHKASQKYPEIHAAHDC